MSNTGLYCSYCGQLNDAEALFCSRCGARQKPGSEASSATPGAAPASAPASFQPVAPSAPQPVYQGATTAYSAPATSSGIPMYRGYGGFWLRVVAAIIDFVVVGIVVFPIRAILFGTTMLPGMMHGGEPNVGALMAGTMFGGFFHLAANWIYEAGLESSRYQATLGKMALGLKVTDLNGYRISFARATGRHFAKILSSIILMIGYIMVAFTERKQGLHDILAGTLVVKT